MVGSGKTTAAAHLQGLLESHGMPVAQWRFQALPCFDILRPPSTRKRHRPDPDRNQRWSGYRRKRLTAGVTLGYVLRILAFRWFRRRRLLGFHIANRYFYDNFVHYRLDTPMERLYAGLLQRLMPVPDIPILLVASPETIAERRPNYSPEYLAAVEKAYAALRSRFPELVEISTDPGASTLDRLEEVLRIRLSLIQKNRSR